ncbi:hypothetical protein Ddc_12931 [Ditylenchus destructor]|nr:hypothetical protein Ddc_12931 [Ditylenchus destructor]
MTNDDKAYCTGSPICKFVIENGTEGTPKCIIRILSYDDATLDDDKGSFSGKNKETAKVEWRTVKYLACFSRLSQWYIPGECCVSYKYWKGIAKEKDKS